MCGRYTLATPLGELVELLEADHVAMEEWPPRYNIAPTQDAPVLIAGDGGERRLGTMRWGLVPFWADDPSIGNRMINARWETASEKPAFRQAWSHRRCIVPADGFYEWRKPDGGSGPKTPYWIHPREGRIVAMAGLWERWREGKSDEPLHTFTILTRAASEWMKPLHHRMPVLLAEDHLTPWLAGAGLELSEGDAVPLEAHPVSRSVNSPAHEGPELVAPVEGAEPD